MNVPVKFECPGCGGDSFKVIDSRGIEGMKNTIRRRRQCNSCGYRMTFREMPVENFTIISEDRAALRKAVMTINKVVKKLEDKTMDECCGKCKYHKPPVNDDEEWTCDNEQADVYGFETDYNTPACVDFESRDEE